MVSLRCITKVKTELNSIGLQYINVESGVVQLEQKITKEQRKMLRTKLHSSGMDLLDDADSTMIEKVLKAIAKIIASTSELSELPYAKYLSEKLNLDPVDLNNTFSEVKGLTIHQYIIVNKIEKVKELLLYDVLTNKEIATKLNYKSVPGLSAEFLKITGLTLTFFKNLKKKRKFRPDKKEQ